MLFIAVYFWSHVALRNENMFLFRFETAARCCLYELKRKFSAAFKILLLQADKLAN